MATHCVFKTNTGKHIQAHGGGVLKVNDTYYWVGEDKTDGSSFQNINCYSSTNLVEWSYVRSVLTRQGNGDLGPNRVIERPKIVYSYGDDGDNCKARLQALTLEREGERERESRGGIISVRSRVKCWW